MRWINCPSHHGDDVHQFFRQRFENSRSSVFLVAGAGFDPRASHIPLLLHSILGDRLQTLLLKEERPSTSDDLIERADHNRDVLVGKLENVSVASVEILSDDLSVIGGRAAVDRMSRELSDDFSDIVVDVSALSTGVGFPICRYALEWAGSGDASRGMHVVLAGHPMVDHRVHATPLDNSKEVYGFKGEFGLEWTADAAKLWLPQLAFDQKSALVRIYEEIRPHDVCPILPFPAQDPCSGDRLLEHYCDEILESWEVASKNVIFAAEGKPLDLYRAILRIADERAAVFAETGGSQLILTPTGSKALALGAMMAAIERDLPVRYVESIGYQVDWAEVDQAPENKVELLHLWLAGEPYTSAKGDGH